MIAHHSVVPDSFNSSSGTSASILLSDILHLTEQSQDVPNGISPMIFIICQHFNVEFLVGKFSLHQCFSLLSSSSVHTEASAPTAWEAEGST